jgi:hypothetical protein
MTLEYRDRTPPHEEAGPQGDPMLSEDTVARPWKWAIFVAIAALALTTVYTVMTQRNNEQHASAPPAASGSPPTTGSVPQAPPTGGRTTGDAPTAPPASKPGG